MIGFGFGSRQELGVLGPCSLCISSRDQCNMIFHHCIKKCERTVFISNSLTSIHLDFKRKVIILQMEMKDDMKKYVFHCILLYCWDQAFTMYIYLSISLGATGNGMMRVTAVTLILLAAIMLSTSKVCSQFVIISGHVASKTEYCWLQKTV